MCHLCVYYDYICRVNRHVSMSAGGLFRDNMTRGHKLTQPRHTYRKVSPLVLCFISVTSNEFLGGLAGLPVGLLSVCF